MFALTMIVGAVAYSAGTWLGYLVFGNDPGFATGATVGSVLLALASVVVHRRFP